MLVLPILVSNFLTLQRDIIIYTGYAQESCNLNTNDPLKNPIRVEYVYFE